MTTAHMRPHSYDEVSDMAAPKRPGLKVGARTEFLVIGDVIPGHEEVLRQILKEHMANPCT